MTDHGKGAAPAGRVMTRSLAALHSEDVYRFVSARRVRLGSASEIVYVPHKREACVLPASVSHALSQCTGAASLSTVGSLMVKHGAVRDDHEGDLLALALRQLGLLVPADGLLAGAPGGADEERAARGISTIAIVTCGRSEALIRACDSYLTNAYDFGHSPALLVLDDAESPHPWQRVAGALTRSAAECAAPLWYGGRQERRRFVEALTQGEQLPRDVVRFALFGSGTGGETIGATRNVVLLATQGTQVLSADDDTCCRAFLREEGISRGLRFGGHRDYGEVTFCGDRTAALRQGMPIALDVIGEHQRYLGKTLGELIAAAPREAIDLDQMCPHLWAALCDRQGQISLTLNGLIGDAGMYTNLWVLLSEDRASRLRLCTADALARAMESREIARQARVPTITHVLPFISTFFGLDHRQLLPPFLPEHRNDEGVFADVLARCFGHRYACHLPWMLEHRPVEPRRYASGTAIAQVRVSDVIKACIASWSSPACGRDVTRALSSLGRHLVDLADLSSDDFVEVLRQLLWQRASELVWALEAQYRRSVDDGFAFWAEELATQRQCLESALVDAAYCVPTDLAGPADFAAKMAITQALVRRYGELLHWWPAICERARLLESEGRGPAIRVV